MLRVKILPKNAPMLRVKLLPKKALFVKRKCFTHIKRIAHIAKKKAPYVMCKIFG